MYKYVRFSLFSFQETSIFLRISYRKLKIFLWLFGFSLFFLLTRNDKKIENFFKKHEENPSVFQVTTKPDYRQVVPRYFYAIN